MKLTKQKLWDFLIIFVVMLCIFIVIFTFYSYVYVLLLLFIIFYLCLNIFIGMFMYSHCYVCSVLYYSVFIMPTGTLRLHSLRVFHAFSSVVR